MEHFRNPYRAGELTSTRTVENRRFFDGLIDRARRHRFFAHPFLRGNEALATSREVAAFVLASHYKLVAPCTAMLCSLAGRAPTLRGRFALMDNLYEKLGCGTVEAAQASLYLQMLASIGVTLDEAEDTPVLPPIRRINAHLREVIERRPFPVGCAMLAVMEAVVPPSFPVLAAMARRAYPEADLAFFERHGRRDDGHVDDAGMLFAMYADRSHFAAAEAEVRLDLEYRHELLDYWVSAATRVAQPLEQR